MSGVSAAESGPVAITQNRLLTVSPVSVLMVHRSDSSSSTAPVTRVLKVMPVRRSSLSATQFM